MRDWILVGTPPLSGKPLMRAIVQEIATARGLKPEAIMARDRSAPVASARLEAYSRIQSTGRFSYPVIGRFFDRDHTTIVHGVRSYRRALARQGVAA